MARCVDLLRKGSLVLLLLAARSKGEEIPLETCDHLPVVRVNISGMDFLFLVDTAATSTINVKSFPHGEPQTMSVSSWTGTAPEWMRKKLRLEILGLAGKYRLHARAELGAKVHDDAARRSVAH